MPWREVDAENRGDRADLAEVVISDGEPFEVALKRFNKRVQQDGILAEARRREHYEKPSVKRKKKEQARLRKLRKKQLRSEARAASRR
jgi:small subunit ribosomal protein S21